MFFVIKLHLKLKTNNYFRRKCQNNCLVTIRVTYFGCLAESFLQRMSIVKVFFGQSLSELCLEIKKIVKLCKVPDLTIKNNKFRS